MSELHIAYYIRVYQFLSCVVKDNENWLSFLKIRARRGFLALGSSRKTTLGKREETR
jgi:hypothetical protein